MPDKQDYNERRSTHSIYENYIKNSKGDNKSHFESKELFRNDFSRYNIQKQSIEAGANCGRVKNYAQKDLQFPEG